MFPKLREYVRRQFGVRSLKINIVVDHNGADVKRLHLKLTSKHSKFKAHVYTNWYMWDCHKLEATPLPDDVVHEIKETTDIFKQAWISYQTANL